MKCFRQSIGFFVLALSIFSGGSVWAVQSNNSALPSFLSFFLANPLETVFHVQDLKLQHVSLSGDIHCGVSRVSADVTSIVLSSEKLVINGETLQNVRGEFLLHNNGTLIVKALDLDMFFLSGKVDLTKQELDLNGELRSVPIEDVFFLLAGKSMLFGKASGKIKIQGSFDAWQYKGFLAMERGTIKGFPFSEALFHYAGNYLYCTLSNSYIKSEDVRYNIDGTLGLQELADLEKVGLNIMPERLVIDGWKVSQQPATTNDTLLFSKKGGSNFSVDFDSNKSDSSKENPGVGVAFQKTLGVDNFLKFRMHEGTSSVVVGKQIDF